MTTEPSTQPTTTPQLAMVTIDCADARELADFYCELLGWSVTSEYEGAVMIGSEGATALGFGEVPDYQPPRWPDTGAKQFHLDLDTDDIEAAQQRALALGATLAEPQPGETWRVLLDPAGHPFCLANWSAGES